MTDRSSCAAAPGFTDVLLRGDTDFSLTTEFDRWDADGVRFVFGYDAKANLVATAAGQPPDLYHELAAKAERQIATRPRTRPTNVKDDIVRQRAYKTIRPKKEEVVEFSYRPRACQQDYRVVAVRKNLSIQRGDNVLFDEYRYFFYITNDWTLTAEEVIGEAHRRCNQENLISNLKSGVRALHAPVNTLHANWAYITMASLAWTLKAWCALMLPISPRWQAHHQQQRSRLLTMEFRTFRAALIDIPCQIVTTGRYLRWRIQAWNPWFASEFVSEIRRFVTPTIQAHNPTRPTRTAEPAHRLCLSHPQTRPLGTSEPHARRPDPQDALLPTHRPIGPPPISPKT